MLLRRVSSRNNFWSFIESLENRNKWLIILIFNSPFLLSKNKKIISHEANDDRIMISTLVNGNNVNNNILNIDKLNLIS